MPEYNMDWLDKAREATMASPSLIDRVLQSKPSIESRPFLQDELKYGGMPDALLSVAPLVAEVVGSKGLPMPIRAIGALQTTSKPNITTRTINADGRVYFVDPGDVKGASPGKFSLKDDELFGVYELLSKRLRKSEGPGVDAALDAFLKNQHPETLRGKPTKELVDYYIGVARKAEQYERSRTMSAEFEGFENVAHKAKASMSTPDVKTNKQLSQEETMKNVLRSPEGTMDLRSVARDAKEKGIRALSRETSLPSSTIGDRVKQIEKYVKPVIEGVAPYRDVTVSLRKLLSPTEIDDLVVETFGRGTSSQQLASKVMRTGRGGYSITTIKKRAKVGDEEIESVKRQLWDSYLRKVKTPAQ